MLVQEGIHGVATVAEKGVADVAKGLGDITGQHAIFDKLGAHVDAAIAGAATEATIATSTVATLAETSVNASALIATHPTLAPKIAALAVETDIQTATTAAVDTVTVADEEVHAQISDL